MLNQTSPVPARRCATRPTTKPYTVAELHAKSVATEYLQLAQSHARTHDSSNAVSFCLEGLRATFGISRPLAVRDQLNDLLTSLNIPGGHQSAAQDYGRITLRLADTAGQRNAKRTPRHLERLVSAHQLCDYPSDLPRFNQAYLQAGALLRVSPHMAELYIVHYHGPLSNVPNDPRDLHFAVVEPQWITENGPFYLIDICAVARR